PESPHLFDLHQYSGVPWTTQPHPDCTRYTQTCSMGLRSGEYGGQSSNTLTSFSSNHAIVSLAVCTLALSCIKIGLIPISPNSSKKSSKEKSNVLTYALASTLPPSTTLIPLHVPFNPPAKQAYTICLTF